MQQRHKNLAGAWVKCNATRRKCPREHMAEDQYQLSQRTDPGYVSHEQAPRPPFDFREGRVSKGPEVVCVAPPGSSGHYCIQCKRYQPKSLFEDSAEGYVNCVSCGVRTALNGFGTDICSEELRYFSNAAVRKAHWFHISRGEDWLDTARENEAMVHLGSHEAAMIRLRDIVREDASEDDDEDGWGEDEAKALVTVPGEYYLYEVRLKPNVEIAPGIFRDQEAKWPDYIDEVEGDFEGSDYPFFSATGVSRYMNEYEGAGTISLLSNPNAYELVARIKIPHRG